MIGLDTNVLARHFVALELEWVLRGYYGFAAPQVLAVFDLLLGHPTLTLEDRPALRVGFRRCPPSRQLPHLPDDRLLR